MKTVQEHVAQFLENTTPAELQRIALEFLKELNELKDQRGGIDISGDDLVAITSLQSEKWHEFATIVNRKINVPIIDPDLLRDRITHVLLKMLVDNLFGEELGGCEECPLKEECKNRKEQPMPTLHHPVCRN